jgi:hypothetical protein
VAPAGIGSPYRMVSSHRARVGPNMFPLPKKYTLWLFNMAMENGPFIVSFAKKNVMFHGYVK